MELKDSKGKFFIVDDTPFAHGGEGDVHIVTSTTYEGCCVKIFHPGKMNERKEKIEYQIKHSLSAPANAPYRICWPLDFAYQTNNECIGFIMHLAFDGSRSLYDINLKDGSDVFKRSTERGMTNRMRLLYNISNIIGILHQFGYVIADFKPQNVLFTESGKISMIDTDSVQIVNNGMLMYGTTAVTAEYAYPNEIQLLKAKKPLTSAWDIYSFAIVAYQILLGIHPFTASTDTRDAYGSNISTSEQLMSNNLFPFGPRSKDILAKPPIHNYFLQLHKTLRLLFIQTFDLAQTPPHINEWRKALKDVISNNLVVSNLFRVNPKVPIFILTKDLPENAKEGQAVNIEWITHNCEKLIIKGIDRSNENSAKLVIPSDRTVDVVATNQNATTTIKILFPLPSLFCTRCGTKFDNDEDLYCTNCGAKRE